MSTFLEPIIKEVSTKADGLIKATNADMVKALQGVTDPDEIRRIVTESTATVDSAKAAKAGDIGPTINALMGEVKSLLFNRKVELGLVPESKAIEDFAVRYDNGEVSLVNRVVRLKAVTGEKTKKMATVYTDSKGEVWGEFRGRGHGYEIVSVENSEVGDGRGGPTEHYGWLDKDSPHTLLDICKANSGTQTRLMAFELAGVKVRPYKPTA